MLRFIKSNIAGLFILLIILVGIAGIYYYLNTSSKTNNKDVVSDKDAAKIVQQLGKIMVLPEEKPELATVTDVEKLKGEPFFNDARNGDRLLIFKQSGKVILYRAAERKIISVSSFKSVADNSTQAEASPSTQVKNIKLIILNGTSVTGLAAKTEQTLKEKDLIARYGIEVKEKTNAEKDTYTETVVVDLSDGKLGDAPQKIADLLKAKVVKQMPEGEKKLVADMIIIAGKN